MSAAVTDNDIREKIAADDPAALGLIWALYGLRLHAFLVTLLRSTPDAEDVLQDVFVKVATQRSRLLEVKNLQAYFFAMARNEALTLIRRRSRHPEPPHPDDLWLVPADASSLREDTAAKVRLTLESLPEEQRTVLVLKVYQELTFQEIAGALGISLNTAASRYRYAMDKLRVWLKEEKS
jgi:RNA polymerase sigma-70 factor (ECF subfamily)